MKTKSFPIHQHDLDGSFIMCRAVKLISVHPHTSLETIIFGCRHLMTHGVNLHIILSFFSYFSLNMNGGWWLMLSPSFVDLSWVLVLLVLFSSLLLFSQLLIFLCQPILACCLFLLPPLLFICSPTIDSLYHFTSCTGCHETTYAGYVGLVFCCESQVGWVLSPV